MLFLKIMFWVTIVGMVIQAFLCGMDHPREIKQNLGTDIVVLLEKIALVVFFWLYTFGGWTVR